MTHSCSYSHYIAGGYAGSSGGLTSGAVFNGSTKNYARTIQHLFDVLDAACATGNPYWGNKGVCISKWIHGEMILVSHVATVQFDTRAQLELFLETHGIAVRQHEAPPPDGTED